MKDIPAKFLEALARTERLPPAALSRYQQQLLTGLVRHASDHLPFYRDRLRCLFTATGDVDLSRWNDVPFLTREDVLAHTEAMRVADLPAAYGEVAAFHTSGTTGMPLQVFTNGLVYLCSRALLTRTARRFGMDPSRPMAMISASRDHPERPRPEGNTDTGWSVDTPGTPHYMLDLQTPVDQQVEWLARHRAPYLMTQPSAVVAISLAVTPAVGHALGIETILMYGETVQEGTRELIAERLGARAVAIYACNEIGHIASECESATHYHVAAENALVEIVDDEGRDVAPGVRGRVVVTGFYNYAMPFIRYHLDDFAVGSSAPCACGRTLPVITQIEGRVRNPFIFRDGSRMWPRGATVRPMKDFVAFARYQFVQLDYETIELRYIPDGSGREPDLPGLDAYARRALHPSVNIRLHQVKAMETPRGGKFQDFISLVKPAATPDRA
jgi:phenylacetate-CoA ligase